VVGERGLGLLLGGGGAIRPGDDRACSQAARARGPLSRTRRLEDQPPRASRGPNGCVHWPADFQLGFVSSFAVDVEKLTRMQNCHRGFVGNSVGTFTILSVRWVPFVLKHSPQLRSKIANPLEFGVLENPYCPSILFTDKGRNHESHQQVVLTRVGDQCFHPDLWVTGLVEKFVHHCSGPGPIA